MDAKRMLLSRLLTPIMADSSQRREIDAFFNFFATFDLTRPALTVSDLADGAALFEVLAVV